MYCPDEIKCSGCLPESVGDCDICEQPVMENEDRVEWACGSVIHGACQDAAEGRKGS